MVRDRVTEWKQTLEAIHPADADSRQRLNQLYTEIVTELRQQFQAANFDTAAPSLDQKRAAKAADPSTSSKRLWDLASHYPEQVTNNPIWALLLLGGKGLVGKDEYVSADQLVPFAQVEDFCREVHRRHEEDYYSKLLLSYTALLPLEKHPYRTHPLVKDLYQAGENPSAANLSYLEAQTNELDSYGKGMLRPIQEALHSLGYTKFALPGELDPRIADDVLLALSPVFAEGDELVSLVFRRNAWGSHKGVFLDASPIASLLLPMSKTRLVDSGVCIDGNTLYPAEVYERLASHRNSGPQSEVAGCIHTPVKVLEQLAKSTSKEVIYPLACNPMTPIAVLRQLMSWSGWGAKTVQGYVQANPAYTGGEVWQLTELGRVQLQTDQHKKDVLKACLQLLSNEANPLDGVRLLLNASIWANHQLEPSILRLKMIEKGWASEELMLAAAWSWHWLERLAVAKSHLAPASALSKLQRDGLPFIRHAALQPRQSAEVTAEAASANGWMGQLAAIANTDPIICVQSPRFAEWLHQEPERVAALLKDHHRTVLTARDIPPEYFCWRLSQASEREQLRILMHPQVPQQALDQLVRHDTEHDKLFCQVPRKKQGDLAELIASSAASHLQQCNPDLLNCSRAELEKREEDDLSPIEVALFAIGFYSPADVSRLHTYALLQLLLHPAGSEDLRRHLVQELERRSDEWPGLGNYRSPGYVLKRAYHPYLFLYGREHELSCLMAAGQLLGLEESSEGLRAWFVTLIGDLAAEILIDRNRGQWLGVLMNTWPATLSAVDTRKLLSSRNVSKRLVAVCFGNLNEAQMEALTQDSREEVRFALALLRPCTDSVLEKLAADSNELVKKAAIQNQKCPLSTLKKSQGLSALRNPNLPEETARQLLNQPARKQYLKHAHEILCWTPAIIQEILNSLDGKELRSFLHDLDYGHDYASFAERPYSAELLSWMAQLAIEEESELNTLRQLAATHPGTPVSLLEELGKVDAAGLGYSIASNPACPAMLRRTLRELGIRGDLMTVIASPNYPVDWLAEHVEDPDPDVRAKVALHPHCPLPLLAQLLSDSAKTSKHGPFKDRTVADVAATSPALTTLRDPASYEVIALALLRSTKPTFRARRLALHSAHCPQQLLRRCASSLDWRERYAVASHPSTPVKQLKTLRMDANQHVAQMAIKRCSKKST